jgi:hypothetical protein
LKPNPQAKKPAKDDVPVVRSAPAKDAAKPAPRPGTPGQGTVDPYAFWLDFFTKTRFKTPTDAQNSLFETVADLRKAGKIDHVEAAIKAFMQPTTHGKDAQPWMYEVLVLCLESRKKDDPAAKDATAREVRQTIGYAAHLAKKLKSPVDLRRVADMLILRNEYGTVGDPGFQTSVAELVDLATKNLPSDPYAPMMSINLATHDKDPKRMGEAAEQLLSLGWPGYDDKVRRDVKEQVKKMADALRVDNKSDEAEALMARLAESEARDVFLRLTWKGVSDIDMSVAEPLGATAQYHNPRTVFGGAIIKNGYGSHPEEVYVCPRAFDGAYTVAVEKVVDDDPAKPVNEATLEIILHEGTAEETRETRKINLSKPEPVVFKLTGGRRKEVLPFFVTKPEPVAAAAPRPKAAPKGAARPAPGPQGVPFR